MHELSDTDLVYDDVQDGNGKSNGGNGGYDPADDAVLRDEFRKLMEEQGFIIPHAGDMDLEELVRHLITAASTRQRLRNAELKNSNGTPAESGQDQDQDISNQHDDVGNQTDHDDSNQYTTMSRPEGRRGGYNPTAAEAAAVADYILGVKAKKAPVLMSLQEKVVAQQANEIADYILRRQKAAPSLEMTCGAEVADWLMKKRPT